jgi:uncharacterized glyoxalase superfamily protein PhnB
MKSKIALLTILTDYVPDMVNFYVGVLGFKEKLNMGKYVELENEGVRFAICDREIMLKATQDRAYLNNPEGQAFELAFPCDTPDDVDRSYQMIVANGAKPIQPPASMEWGQRTAFFADPDGNIHELFSEIDT